MSEQPLYDNTSVSSNGIFADWRSAFIGSWSESSVNTISLVLISFLISILSRAPSRIRTSRVSICSSFNCPASIQHTWEASSSWSYRCREWVLMIIWVSLDRDISRSLLANFRWLSGCKWASGSSNKSNLGLYKLIYDRICTICRKPVPAASIGSTMSFFLILIFRYSSFSASNCTINSTCGKISWISSQNCCHAFSELRSSHKIFRNILLASPRAAARLTMPGLFNSSIAGMPANPGT